MNYLLYGLLFLVLLALTGFIRIHLAMRRLGRRGDEAQEFMLCFDRFRSQNPDDRNSLRRLAVSSKKFQEGMDRAFRRAGVYDIEHVDIYQVFRQYRKEEVDDSKLILAREKVSRFMDIINYSQDHLRKMMTSPLAILAETGKLLTFQPLIFYYSKADNDPLSAENKGREKDLKKIIAFLSMVLGLILTALGIINSWLAYFGTIFSLVE